MSESDRETVVARLREDLIGPLYPDEVVRAYPSDLYLTGILWPSRTGMTPEDDDRLEIAASPRGAENSADGDEAVPISVSMKPCTAGLSFAVESTVGDPQIDVSVQFGTYTSMEEQDDQEGHDRSKPKIIWQRRQWDIAVPNLAVNGGTGPRISLAPFGGPNQIYLYKRVAHWEKNKFVITLTLVNDANPDRSSGREGLESATLFQTSIAVNPCSGTSLVARPSRLFYPDDRPTEETGDAGEGEDLSAELLYRKACEYAVGHSCSARWDDTRTDGSVTKVMTSWIPWATVRATSPEGHSVFDSLRCDERMKPLDARWLSGATPAELGEGMTRLAAAYENWIGLQEQEISGLPERYRNPAARNLEACRAVAGRMREGIARIVRDDATREAFQLANLAMVTQRDWNRGEGTGFFWRPFQLGFILLSIESVADRRHPDRETMDLLWFPTGGGKTEAYLALIAFLAFYRRLSNGDRPELGAGVAAVMRYTLRLLTTQQFVRAASMILACEAIRRGKVPTTLPWNRLGSSAFSIGLWVGDDATPNRYDKAKAAIFNRRSGDSSPEQLSTCPACDEKLTWFVNEKEKAIQVRCDKPDCVLHDNRAALPVHTVDDDIYREKPTLVIGTIDKFAQIVRNSKTASLFSVTSGNGEGLHPPDLIIQDELHLISGPLGTIAGLYEVALDRLFTRDRVKPKIIGSTATIRRAEDQVRALFCRKTCQFPPPGLNADDSGFAVRATDLPDRLYVGITTAGRSAKFTLQAVASSVLQSATAALDEEGRDHYWTLVSYFNSLRELGGALVLMQDDVNKSIALLAERRQEGETQRVPKHIKELTSRRTQREIRSMLDELEIPVGEDGVLDIVLSTNMLSVGVDIRRLGLMLVNGQPKGISEYIQATSRVGRGSVPGLIVSILNNAKARDRSHYESFGTWHSTLYRDVEATSVTPFASRARDRALHAVLVALIRQSIPGMLDKPHLMRAPDSDVEKLVDYIVDRARTVDPEETGVREELEDLLTEWKRLNPKDYWEDRRANTLLRSAEVVATRLALGQPIGPAWSTMNNMRSIEAFCRFRLPPNQWREETEVIHPQ